MSFNWYLQALTARNQGDIQTTRSILLELRRRNPSNPQYGRLLSNFPVLPLRPNHQHQPQAHQYKTFSVAVRQANPQFSLPVATPALYPTPSAFTYLDPW